MLPLSMVAAGFVAARRRNHQPSKRLGEGLGRKRESSPGAMTNSLLERADAGATEAPQRPLARPLGLAEALLSWAALIGFGGYFLLLIHHYLDMFLLIEYRQWIFHAPQAPLLRADFFSTLFELNANPSHFQIVNSRSLSYWMAQLFGRVCGPDPFCHNIFQAALVAGSVAFLALSVRALSISRSWLPALVTGIVTALSMPMIEAITWQATVLDKMAMLLTSGTILGASVIPVANARRRDIVAYNLLLFLLTFAACNSKEAALFLAPATVLLVFSRVLIAGSTRTMAARRTIELTALPLVYSCVHVALVFYNRTFLATGEFNRVTGGDIAFNVEFYARYILDMMPTLYSRTDIAAAAACIGVLMMVAIVLDAANGSRRHVPISLFALVGLAGSLAIPLRTTSTSAFYLLVPIAYFGLAIGLSVDAILARLHGPALRLAFGMICIGFLIARLLSFQSALPDFDRLEQLSRNFVQTLQDVQAASLNNPPERIVFVRPRNEPRAYMYVSAPADAGDYALAPYLAPPGTPFTDLLKFEGRIVDVDADGADRVKRHGDLIVTLGPGLTLAGLSRFQ